MTVCAVRQLPWISEKLFFGKGCAVERSLTTIGMVHLASWSIFKSLWCHSRARHPCDRTCCWFASVPLHPLRVRTRVSACEKPRYLDHSYTLRRSPCLCQAPWHSPQQLNQLDHDVCFLIVTPLPRGSVRTSHSSSRSSRLVLGSGCGAALHPPPLQLRSPSTRRESHLSSTMPSIRTILCNRATCQAEGVRTFRRCVRPTAGGTCPISLGGAGSSSTSVFDSCGARTCVVPVLSCAVGD